MQALRVEDAMTVEELVTSVMPMVRGVAREIAQRMPVEVDELIADGYLGAVKAAKAFDPKRGWEFRTYAQHRVRGEILDGLRRMDYISRDTRRKVGAEVRKAHEAGLEYSDPRTAGPLSLDSSIRVDSEMAPMALSELIADVGRPLDDVFADHDALWTACQSLRGRHAEVIRRLYWEHDSQGEIAASWFVTVSRVSQIHGDALHILRKAFLRSGYDTVRMSDLVGTEARRTGRSRPYRLDSVERGALLGDLIAFWRPE